LRKTGEDAGREENVLEDYLEEERAQVVSIWKCLPVHF